MNPKNSWLLIIIIIAIIIIIVVLIIIIVLIIFLLIIIINIIIIIIIIIITEVQLSRRTEKNSEQLQLEGQKMTRTQEIQNVNQESRTHPTSKNDINFFKVNILNIHDLLLFGLVAQ